jgi:hypothetical protein
MVIRDVGDDDIIIIGYTFSTQNASGVTYDNRKSAHALCLRVCALESTKGGSFGGVMMVK